MAYKEHSCKIHLTELSKSVSVPKYLQHKFLIRGVKGTASTAVLSHRTIMTIFVFFSLKIRATLTDFFAVLYSLYRQLS